MSIDQIKENGFTLKKKKKAKKKKKIHTTQMIDGFSQIYFPRPNLCSIGLYVNSDKSVFIGFKLHEDMSTINDKPLKAVELHNISSSESVVNSH